MYRGGMLSNKLLIFFDSSCPAFQVFISNSGEAILGIQYKTIFRELLQELTKGGGGFKFYTLAPSLLRKDKFDNWIIEPSYNADLLASALAKQEAFTYHPDSELFWKQGYSTENDFIFTTTQFITVELIDRIYKEMGEDESLLVCAKTFQDACLSRYDNITLKKIPKVLLCKCEFGKDDYSLNIIETEEVEAGDE